MAQPTPPQQSAPQPGSRSEQQSDRCRVRPAVGLGLLVLAATALQAACLPGRGPVEPAPSPSPDPVELFPFELPPGFPAPRVPEDNPITAEKIALGRHLFFDKRLSGNGTQSCGSCHEPARAYTDGKALPVGSTGDVIPRNSPMLANVAWWSTYTWANPLLTTLEAQALVPMFSEHPVELGMTVKLPEILGRLEADPLYQELFAAAFPDLEAEEPLFSQKTIVYALATFQRALVSGRSRYDIYANGEDSQALTRQEKLGMQLFFSEETECYHCHGGLLFSTAFVAANSVTTERSFENNGLYNIDGQGAYPPDNTGLYEFTGLPEDMGRFRVPTLRNLIWSAPYFHDGSAATLEDVLAHYMRGGRLVTGEHAGDGKLNPHKNILLQPMNLTEEEQAALLAFLRALSDEGFVTNPAYQDPFAVTDAAD
jgi:cytochrome c peroxidase